MIRPQCDTKMHNNLQRRLQSFSSSSSSSAGLSFESHSKVCSFRETTVKFAIHINKQNMQKTCTHTKACRCKTYSFVWSSIQILLYTPSNLSKRIQLGIFPNKRLMSAYTYTFSHLFTFTLDRCSYIRICIHTSMYTHIVAYSSKHVIIKAQICLS